MDTRETPQAAPETGPRPKRRWGRKTLRGIGLLVALVLLVGVGLAQTRPGQRAVVELALSRLDNVLAGSLTVDRVRGRSLLTGVTLVAVHLTAEGDRPFLDVDSVRVRYSVLSLLGNRPALASVRIWGPHVRIARTAADTVMNVERLLVPGPPASDSAAAAAPPVALGRVRIEGGLLEVLTPAGGDGGPRSVPDPSGEGRLFRLALEGLSLDVEDAVVRPGAADVFQGRLRDFAADVTFLSEPIRLTHMEGAFRFGAAGIAVDDGRFSMPGTTLTGSLEVGPQVTGGGGWALGADLVTDGAGDLTDLRWIDPRIPNGSVRGGVRVTAGGAVEVTLRGVVAELEASTVQASGDLVLDDGPRFRAMEIQASPLFLSRFEPWLERELPLAGFVSGRVTLDGVPGALRTDGRVTLAPEGFGGRPTTADFSGTVRLGESPGLADFRATLDPLNFSLLGLAESSFGGSARGRASVEASGRLEDGLRFLAEVAHVPDSFPESHAIASGILRRAGERYLMDVQGDVTPFSLELVSGLLPGAGLRGLAEGSVRARGPLDSLRVTADLRVGEGRAEVDATFNPAALARGYELSAELSDVRLSDLSSRLPHPTAWSGMVRVSGRGLGPDSAELRAEVTAGRSRVGGLHVDSVSARIRTAAGRLTVDSLAALLGGVYVRGQGSLGLTAGRVGEVRLAFETDQLAGLRPLLLGDTVIARDTLSPLMSELLRIEGVDPDTLPVRADVDVTGSALGEISLRGSLDALSLEGEMVLRRARYGRSGADSVRVGFGADGLPARSAMMRLEVDALRLDVAERSFERVQGSVTMTDWRGSGQLDITMEAGERFAAEGDFERDTLGTTDVRLRRARLGVDSLVWETTRPARVRWDESSLYLEDVELVRAGDDPMRLAGSGVLARSGSSDFHVEVEGIHIEHMLRVVQLEDVEAEGHVDAELRVSGPARSPTIEGSFAILAPRWEDVSLDSVSGALAYEARSATVDVEAWTDERRVFTAEGRVPYDLAFTEETEERTVDRPMDVRVAADSLGASVAFSTLGFLEDVTGTVSGEFRIRGTVEEPEPSGVFRLENAAWTLEALGVRQNGISGSLTLNPDRTVDVEVQARAAGSSDVTGTIFLEPLNNPRLDLTVGFQAFQALDRRDMAGRISGELAVSGTYGRPLVEGELAVDQGTLFLDEFARSAEVVDLTDPRILEVVDTMALASRPILAEIRNPFLQNLRVDIDMSVPRDTWLRSPDMNVEIGGQLLVTYDRTNRDLVLVGELQALRGSYAVLGRTFEVQGGTVGFIGTPGINPTLDIQALTRIRSAGAESERLDINATVAGTLTQPRVTLSTQEPGIAESDLVSYLIFGRPSYQLATGQAAVLAGAASGGVTWATGTLATRLGAAVAQEVGIDYLNISQAGDFAVASGFVSPFANTQVEVGQYLGDDVFFVVILRPLTDQGSQGIFGGARVEWALSDPYTVEGFVEDRFLRSGVGGFSTLDVQTARVLGVFIFREWGY